MRVQVEIESLRCTTGSSNKGYQVIKWWLNGNLVAVTTVYGPLNNPNQSATRAAPDFGALDLGNHAFDVLKSKLKKYSRAHPAKQFNWDGKNGDWIASEGMKFISDALFYGCDLWNTNEASIALNEKLKEPVREIARMSGFSTEETEVEDIFRTPDGRVKVREEQQEVESLDNWGCF